MSELADLPVDALDRIADTLGYVHGAVARIEARLDEQDRKLEAVIAAVPFPYRSAIRKALEHGSQGPGPDRQPRHRSGLAAALIGDPTRRP